MVYQRPLHYLLGIEGVALLRAFVGDFDEEFAHDRVSDIRRLLDDPAIAALSGVDAPVVAAADGYAVWAATYDEPGNGLLPYEEPFVHSVVNELPAGRALDAACGTGRHAGYLARRGHQVVGVDSSRDMLRLAAIKVPDGEFRIGDLDHLPVPDEDVELVVCALALTHLSALTPVFAEFIRVLRPGGHLVVTDIHHATVALGSRPRVRTAAGAGFLPVYRHLPTDYLNAALVAGFELRRGEEARPQPSNAELPQPLTPDTIGEWDDWPWSILGVAPAATRAAFGAAPVTVLWHFQRPE